MIKILIFSLLCFVSCASGSERLNTNNSPLISITEKNVFKVKSSLSWMKDLGEKANCVNFNKDFLKEVSLIESFTHSDHTGVEVVEALTSSTIAVARTYSKRFTRAAAYRVPGTNEIYINLKKLSKRSRAKQVIPTLIHERLHVLGYKHKGNRRAKYNNLESVPYKVSRISKKYISKCD